MQCSFVRRLPTLTRHQFADHWRHVHAPLVPVHHPGVARYVQQVLGLSPTVAGLLMILPVLAQVVAAPIADDGSLNVTLVGAPILF